MKKFNILLFITVIILLLLSGWSIFHQPGYSSEDQFVTPTNIHFEKDTLSLGSVKYGTEQKAVFRFTNTGTASAIDLQCSAIVRLHCCEMEKTPHQTGRIRRDPNRIQPEFTRYVY